MRFSRIANRKAFSLTEMIIALALIAVLIGVAMLVRAGILEDSRKNAWESNMTTLADSITSLRITSNKNYARLNSNFNGVFASGDSFTSWARAVNFGTTTEPLSIAGTLNRTMKSPWSNSQEICVVLGSATNNEAAFRAAKSTYAISDSVAVPPSPGIYVAVSNDNQHFAIMYYLSRTEPTDTVSDGTTPGLHIVSDSLDLFVSNYCDKVTP